MIKKKYTHSLANVCYYEYGSGSKALLCFHGLGMHGKQFHCLADELGSEYTFYGFDLFFHKDTELMDNSLSNIKKGLDPIVFAGFIQDFCNTHRIDKFSLIAYSMGSFYAAVLLDTMPGKIEKAFFLAPSFLKVKPMMKFLSMNKVGNLLFEKLALSDKGLIRLIRFMEKIRVIDQQGAKILYQEVATPKLRFDMYANITYLKRLKINLKRLSIKTNLHRIPLYFIFGKHDNIVSPKLAAVVETYFPTAKIYIAPQGHDLVSKDLTKKMLFCEV